MLRNDEYACGNPEYMGRLKEKYWRVDLLIRKYSAQLFIFSKLTASGNAEKSNGRKKPWITWNNNIKISRIMDKLII